MPDDIAERSPFTPAEALISPDKETPAKLIPPNPEAGGGVYLEINGQKVALAETANYMESHGLEIVIRPKGNPPIAAEQPTPATETHLTPEEFPNTELLAKAETTLQKPPVKLRDSQIIVDSEGTKLTAREYALSKTYGTLCLHTIEAHPTRGSNKHQMINGFIDRNQDFRFTATIKNAHDTPPTEVTIIDQVQEGDPPTWQVIYATDADHIQKMSAVEFHSKIIPPNPPNPDHARVIPRPIPQTPATEKPQPRESYHAKYGHIVPVGSQIDIKRSDGTPLRARFTGVELVNGQPVYHFENRAPNQQPWYGGFTFEQLLDRTKNSTNPQFALELKTRSGGVLLTRTGGLFKSTQYIDKASERPIHAPDLNDIVDLNPAPVEAVQARQQRVLAALTSQ